DWGATSVTPYDGNVSMFSSDAPYLKDDVLDTPPLDLQDASRLSFFHAFDLGLRDGAVLELSTDGGASFHHVGQLAIAGGYDGNVPHTQGSPLDRRPAWVGTSSGFEHVVVPVASSDAVLGAIVRFRLACDGSSGPRTGWFVDDFEVDPAG